MNGNFNLLSENLDLYKKEYISIIESIDIGCLIPVLELLRSSFSDDSGFIYVCGNGGSATLSQHFVTDLGIGTKRRRNKGLRIIDLTSNAAVMSAAANDTGYHNVFSSQIELYGKPGEVLIAVSSSGNSKNVLNAVEKAKELNISTIGLTGFDGGELRKIVDFPIHIETEIGNYGMVEDAHSFVLHSLTYFLRLQPSEVK